jgi:isoleucyl-tRNA synthetase
MTKMAKPNYSSLGPRFKEKAKIIIDKIESLDKIELYEELMKNQGIVIELGTEKIKLTKDDFETIEREKEHVAFAEAEDMSLFLDTTLTPELEAEGFAREMVRRIQSMRKELNLVLIEKRR